MKYLLIIVSVFVIILIWGLFDDGTENLGGGYKYYPDNDFIAGSSIMIPPYIEGFKTNKSHIIVKQRLKGLKPAAIFYDIMDYNFYLGLDTVYYWIINKRDNSYFGPIGYDEFVEKKDSLHIKLKF